MLVPRWILRSAVVAAMVPMVPMVPMVLMSGAGCSSSKTAPETLAQPTAADGLTNLRDLFRQAAAGKATLPTSAADFAAVEPFYPVAGPFVLSGAVDSAWGAGVKQGGDAATRLLAWETAAAKDGGWAMFQDGTIRELTADEFAAAKKAAP